MIKNNIPHSFHNLHHTIPLNTESPPVPPHHKLQLWITINNIKSVSNLFHRQSVRRGDLMKGGEGRICGDGDLGSIFRGDQETIKID